MMYVSDLFLMPGLRTSKGTKGFISKLAKIQRQVTLHITGALRSAPTDAIDACTELIPFHCQSHESLGERSSPGESQIHWGPGRTLKEPREVARPRRGELWNAQAAQWHKGVYN